MVLTRASTFARNNPWVIGFGQLPGSPFHDARLRQAVSMMMDRDGMIEIEQSPSTFSNEGIPVELGWHSHISAGETKFWLDPRDEKQIGAGAKNFKYDIVEAKKLLRAAGAENLETTFAYSAGSGADPLRDSALGQLLRDGGLKSEDRPLNYQNDYVPNYLRAHGMFPGLALLRGTTAPEIDGHLSAKLQPQGINSWIGLPIGGGAHELIAAARKELDDQKRTTMIKDLQKILAVEMPAAPFGGLTKTFSLHWPWFGNKEAIVSWQHAPSEEYPLLWYDESKLEV
jgi:ABC-type transport system substrate-binding protein